MGMEPIQADTIPSLVEIKQCRIINGKINFNVGDKVFLGTVLDVSTTEFVR